VLNVSNLQTSLIGPVNLSVAACECIAIEGKSGSGKSLLLRAIADLDPNEGDVRLGSRARDRMPAWQWRRKVALVPAQSGWWADKVADHFENGANLQPLLAAIGLPDALHWDVERLSTGERHRLAIARALYLGPDALLLDEPTAALDSESAARIDALIAQEMRRGVAVVLVTHDPAQAERLGATRYVMNAGSLTPAGEPSPAGNRKSATP